MVHIDEPAHGAILNHRHGQQSDSGLKITVTGTAGLRERVRVNGAEATRAGERFTAAVALRDHANEIVATANGAGGESRHAIRVIWDRHSRPRYRFSIDDNSFFLRDVAAKKYQSLFDCFYLGNLRELHRKYGTKFVLNLFFTTPEHDFTLAQFPDAYRDEWADNAPWLKLSFHAYAEFPSRPYQYASAEQLGKDFDAVASEVLRFAGEASWSPPTVIHWGMLHHAAFPALVKRGVKVLSGFFLPNAGGDYVGDAAPSAAPTAGYDIDYSLDDARSDYVAHHDALMDFERGVVFSRCDLVCNNCRPEHVVPRLEPLTRDPNTAEIMDLFTHEQYFWPFYCNYLADHVERVDTALRFCAERGYEPVFFHEGFMGVPA